MSFYMLLDLLQLHLVFLITVFYPGTHENKVSVSKPAALIYSFASTFLYKSCNISLFSLQRINNE